MRTFVRVIVVMISLLVAQVHAQTATRWRLGGLNGPALQMPACLPQTIGPGGLSGYMGACRTAYRNDGSTWTCYEGWDEDRQKIEYLCRDGSPSCGDFCGKETYDQLDIPVIDKVKPAAPQRCNCDFKAGNPIYPLRGTKQENLDTDLRLGGLQLRLTYDSGALAPLADKSALPNQPQPKGLGAFWFTNLHRQMAQQFNYRGVLFSRGDGRITSFTGDGSGVYAPYSDTNDRLTGENGGVFRYVSSNDQIIEDYNLVSGQQLRMFWPSGPRVEMAYSDGNTPPSVAPGPGYLIQATDQFGRTLNFEYASARLSKIVDVAGQAITLSYDAQGNLANVVWPDTTTRTFLYELPTRPAALTGVVDEKTIRYATFGYDTDGRATSTEYSGAVNRYSASYASPPSRASVDVDDWTQNVVYRTHSWTLPQALSLTEPLGGSTALSAVTIDGRSFLSGQSQPAGSGCAASTSSQSYDANGNLTSKDDFNGTRTCYANDLSRNLETVRVEGLATTANCGSLVAAMATLPASSRKVSTQWHPDWKLEAKIAEPGRFITKVYNGQPDPFNGGAVASCAPATALLPDGKPITVLCKQVEQATTDADGHLGFSAALQSGVVNRTSSWTYNQYGQVLTEDGPRTDVNDVTTYAYYSDTTADHTMGDLQSVTNAAGKVTSYSKYNKHGQLLESTDPNGVLTVNTYDLRQRLLSSTVGGQTTSYAYDPAGQLKKVTLPDASWIGYDYDAAHRQVAVYDHKGNRTEYQLDNAGNRTGETTKDPNGALKRQLSRSIDALGRVQQTTGRE